MVMKLLVGLSKKVGQPNYGSLGASCHLEIELDSAQLHYDLSGLQENARRAFIACTQAVQDELCRHSRREPAALIRLNESNREATPPERAGPDNGNSRAESAATTNGKNDSSARPKRRATLPQVRAIEALSSRQSFPLAERLHEQYQVADPRDLSVAQASLLLDEIRARGHDETQGTL